MWKAAPKFLLVITRHAILAGLVVVMAGRSVFAQHPPGAFINSPASLSSLACKQYLSGKREESLALYQKAIDKAEQDYGKNSSLVGDLNYEMGVRAYDLCKFDLAEHCLKKAAAINSNSMAAQLMLGQLLRFRNKNSEAYAHIEKALSKHWDASEGRRELMLCLQDVDPASAAQQAFIINCLQNGFINKIPSGERPSIIPAAKNPEPAPVKPPAAAITAPEAKATEKQNKTVKENKKQTDKQSNKIVSAGHGKGKNKAGKAHKKEHSPSLLVPPPPLPAWFGWTGFNKPKEAPSQPEAGLKAKAGSIKKDKKTTIKTVPEETAGGEQRGQAEEAPKANVKRPAESDSDFLLDWGGIKKKPGKK